MKNIENQAKLLGIQIGVKIMMSAVKFVVYVIFIFLTIFSIFQKIFRCIFFWFSKLRKKSMCFMIYRVLHNIWHPPPSMTFCSKSVTFEPNWAMSVCFILSMLTTFEQNVVGGARYYVAPGRKHSALFFIKTSWNSDTKFRHADLKKFCQTFSDFRWLFGFEKF